MFQISWSLHKNKNVLFKILDQFISKMLFLLAVVYFALWLFKESLTHKNHIQYKYLQESFQLLNPEKRLSMCRFKDLNDPFKEFFQFKLSNCSLLIDHRIRLSNYQLRGNRHLNSGFYLTIICKYLETALSINLKQLFFLLFFYLSLIH